MSQGQPVAKSRGLWAPRTRLKIFAVLTALQCVSLGVQFLADFQIVPRWVDASMLLGNALLALMLWLVAAAPRPSLTLVSVAIAVLLARLGLGSFSLRWTQTSVDAVAVISVLSGAAIFAFVFVTIRAIRAESSATVTPAH